MRPETTRSVLVGGRRRRGVTLAEVLAAITIAVIFATIAAVVFAALSRFWPWP